MDSIEFKIRPNDEPYKIDFNKIDLRVLHDICRILDIEGHKESFTLNVNREVYIEIEELIYSNCWLLLPNQYNSGEQKVKLNGFELTFKRNDIWEKH